MGCDGGTIPRRDELVKTKQKPEEKDKVSERLYRWRHCAVSQRTLKQPIVACEMGRLYNKDEVITRLLEKAEEPLMEHIKGLKDIKELNLTLNPAYEGNGTTMGDSHSNDQTAEYVCPVTTKEMNGSLRFSFMWNCGCVISARALKEVKSDVCHKCGGPYDQENVITLNPTEEELDWNKSCMLSRRAIAKAAKKAKKEGKRLAGEGMSLESGSTNGDDAASSSKKVKYSKSVVGAPSSKSSMRVSSSASAILRDKEFDNVRSSGFSVAKDSNVSEVYKSLFDTHKSAQGKVEANWVTCNPQYY